MDTGISCHIGKASGAFARLSARVWDNSSYLSSQCWLLIVPAFVILFCMTAKRGPCQMCKRKKLKASTNNGSVVFLELGGSKRLPTKKSWEILVSPSCTPTLASAGIAGLVMSWGWATSASQRLCYTVSWSLINVTSVDQDYNTTTSASAKLCK